jgi:hypothetical protein
MDVPALVEAGDVERRADHQAERDRLVRGRRHQGGAVPGVLAKGFFSPNDKMRGRGAWTLPRRNQLVYHAGDELWTCEKGRFEALPTGVYDGKLYPHLSALPAPWTKPITPAENPAARSCWPAFAAANGRGRRRPDPAAGLDRLRPISAAR